MIIKDKKFSEIENILGLEGMNKSLLTQALTHTSYANENRFLGLDSNQRLEFLGDAVLEIVISDHLYKNHPTYTEGILTKTRAAVVCEPSLAKVAESLKLGTYLLMGKGESKSGGRERPSILADAFEAIVGAVYLDRGLEEAKNFILLHLKEVLAIYASGQPSGDYKSELQELIQQKTNKFIEYVIIKEEGPDHNKFFTAGVKVNGELRGQGTGKTKKMAEQAAAEDTLRKIEKGEITID